MIRVKKQKPLSFEEASDLQPSVYLPLYADHVNRPFVRQLEAFGLIRRYVSAQGIHLWDGDGDKYYDFFSGFGCLNLGHNHPKVLDALGRAIRARCVMIHQVVPSRFEAALAASLTSTLPDPLRVCYFQSSGSEAIEAGIKLVRRSTGRHHLLSTHKAYHGTTFGALSLTGIPHYSSPFKPLLPSVSHVAFGDLDAVERELRTRKYAGIVLEPIQGQGGIHVAPDGYLRGVRDLCDRFGTLLVLDEAQTGLGRTGRMFALEHESVVPDVLIVSKSLGGGVMPLSACVTTPTIWNRVYGTVRSFRLHQSSFSGNALACISGLATLTTLVEERLCENAETQGRYFRDGLIRLAEVHETLVEVRGRGLMIGVRLDVDAGGLIEGISKRVLGPLAGQMVTAHIASRLLNEFHVIVAPSLTDECVIRLFPPLTVTSRDIDYFLEAFGAVCGSVGTHTDVLRKTTRQLARQVVARVRHN